MGNDQRPAGDPTMRWNERAFGGWDRVRMDEGDHRRRSVVLAVVVVLLLVLGFVIHPVFSGLALLAAILLAIEYAMWRRSRPTSRIPDYRPPPHVNIELED